MSYCSRSDLEKAVEAKALVDLTDDESAGSTNPLVETRIAEACAKASGLVDSYLEGRYSLPLATVPEAVKSIAEDITLQLLFLRRPSIGIPEGIAARYKTAVEMLKAMRDGKQDLGVSDRPAKAPTIVAKASGPERLFTADKMKGF